MMAAGRRGFLGLDERMLSMMRSEVQMLREWSRDQGSIEGTFARPPVETILLGLPRTSGVDGGLAGIVEMSLIWWLVAEMCQMALSTMRNGTATGAGDPTVAYQF